MPWRAWSKNLEDARGLLGIAPAIPLILMASSVKWIVVQGGVMDTILYNAAATAYCFGDGFSNLAYPTNPVLLICLGLTVVSYPRWLKWTAKLWCWVHLVTLAFLEIAVAIHYGPF